MISEITNLFIEEHEKDDVHLLALQASKYPQVDMMQAVTQITGRKIAAEKIPSWRQTKGIWYPPHLSLEQCSSEITAKYKTEWMQGTTLTDLTGGMGVDCAFLAGGFNQIDYVEQQEHLCELARHNFPLLGLPHIKVHQDDAVRYLHHMNPVDCIFLDPARRNEQGRKTVAISDCEPDVGALEELLLQKAQRVMIKLSPMLDLSIALKELKQTIAVHIISVNNECKELLVILDRSQTSMHNVPIHCINLSAKETKEKQTFIFTREQESEAPCNYTAELGKYLYEPNASLLKAGAFHSLANAFGIKKLHPNSHLYTSDTWISHFPGRSFSILRQGSFNKKEIKQCLDDIKQGNLTTRNFPASVAELRKRLKLNEGGNAYFFATTLNNGQKILIRCKKEN